jgi:CobQ-like glutamine amidotransferase family enzyme
MTAEPVAMPLTILHLYPVEMSTYGDWGNVVALRRRAEWHGYAAELLSHHPGETFPANVDVVVGGGGQDSGQLRICDDLLRIGDDLRSLAERQVPMLMVCGLYQLFGHYFQTSSGHRIPGIGVFDAQTHAGARRLTGNVTTRTAFGEILGYENHSGVTELGAEQAAFGTIVQGVGNNTRDTTEGAVRHNVYGTYLHGPLLPKNPHFADALVAAAARRRYGEFEPRFIDDSYADLARASARKRRR